MTDVDVALVGAGIAASATVVGVVLGSLLQAWLARRQRGWAVEDAETQRQHDVVVRQAEQREHRFLTLRAERRETYAAFLDHTHEYMTALRDVRDGGLPKGLEVTTSADVESAHPVAARALAAMNKQGRLDSDIVLIADSEVRKLAAALSDGLRDAFRAAAIGEDRLGEVYPVYHATVAAMRRELVGSDRAAEPRS